MTPKRNKNDLIEEEDEEYKQNDFNKSPDENPLRLSSSLIP